MQGSTNPNPARELPVSAHHFTLVAFQPLRLSEYVYTLCLCVALFSLLAFECYFLKNHSKCFSNFVAVSKGYFEKSHNTGIQKFLHAVQFNSLLFLVSFLLILLNYSKQIIPSTTKAKYSKKHDFSCVIIQAFKK